MSISQTIGTAMITSVLMIFLTDYAGLYTGVPGAAAAAAATMLVVGRVWDAVNDPILGFVMDRTPRTRYGRFKPYIAAAIPISALLLIAMFNLPLSMSDTLKLVLVYVLYLLFDSAFTLMPFNPLIQTMSPDARVRSKLLGPPRIVGLVAAAFMTALIPVAYALGPQPGQANIGLAVTLFMCRRPRSRSWASSWSRRATRTSARDRPRGRRAEPSGPTGVLDLPSSPPSSRVSPGPCCSPEPATTSKYALRGGLLRRQFGDLGMVMISAACWACRFPSCYCGGSPRAGVHLGVRGHRTALRRALLINLGGPITSQLVLFRCSSWSR
jgi:hypothetical protein